MRLINFSVKNYKVFKTEFSIEFSKDSIAILTGRNNTGKSTILEAIDRFFLMETKPKTIPNNCFSVQGIPIELTATFESEEGVKSTFVKKYEEDKAPKFFDEEDVEIKNAHVLKDILDNILKNEPFYITPSMLPDDINKLVQNIYSEIIKNNLIKLENNDVTTQEDKQLAKEYEEIKRSYPAFINKIKSNTDKTLSEVSEDVSSNLRDLFSNDGLTLNVLGGESEGFSSNDILKSTNSVVNIDSKLQSEMPLANQGTGLQRMSLIYLIQNMIEKKLIGENDNKLLLIDEPEAFLHPEAVRALSSSLYHIGKKMPLMISTHSPILIDLAERHTSIQVFRIGKDEAIQLYKSGRDEFIDDDIRNMKILNYIDSYVNEFFFADKILIVEGDTEYIAFKHIAKSRKINVHIIRARGKSTIGTLMKVLNQFNTDYSILHDVDNHDRYKSSALKAQKTNCKNIYNLKRDNNVRIYCSVANFENAIGIGDVPDDKKTETIYKILNESEGNKYDKEKIIIIKLFEHLVGIVKEGTVGGNFYQVKNSNYFDQLFDEMISEKTTEELLQKEKEKEEEEREEEEKVKAEADALK